MLAKTKSYGISGLDVYPVTIEVDAVKGLPATIIVGLPDNAIKESKERVRSAIKNSGFQYKSRRITVNLSPADVKKEGSAYELAIALAILAATDQIPTESLKNFIALGELALDGSIRPVNGILPIALALRQEETAGLLVPQMNSAEAAIAAGISVYPVKNLNEVVHLLTMNPLPAPMTPKILSPIQSAHDPSLNFADVKGQQTVKRGLEIAAAGAHNCLLIGPPGSGKTMLAKRLPGILPEMSYEEAIETTRIHSIMGLLPPGKGLMQERPFRSPHHTSSDVALVGGGTIPKPGEVTLSHNGILFLDELPEFNRNVLESLRQPLEDHAVTIARAVKAVRFPARFMLLASMNPCPCGFISDPKKSCHCSPQQIQKYLSKISGPLLDRIDLHIEVPALPSTDLLSPAAGESSATIQARVVKIRNIQAKRFVAASIFANGQMSAQHVKKFCALDSPGRTLIKRAIDELGFSARAYDKILKVGRTIADMDDSPEIRSEHLAEAIQFRSLDKTFAERTNSWSPPG